ncbi:MAG: hypothetical protein QM759_16560 [Terricaulis sp.]
MARPPVPQRIPPLRWRTPAFVWTPIGLLIGIGWPMGLFFNDMDLQKVIVIVTTAVFAFALVTLGVSWAVGAAPKTRRAVILHVLAAGFVASLAAPYVLTRLFAAVGGYEKAGAAVHVPMAMSEAMTPLALMIGLPLALISGAAFAWIALTRQRPDDLPDNIRTADVQPFR